MMQNKKMAKSALESMMFVTGEPLDVRSAAEALDGEKKEVLQLLTELQDEYEEKAGGIRIRRIEDSFQFVTARENDVFIEKLCTPVRVKRLSQAALEVLAIIAYRQPVTRGEIDSIRGIKSERVIDNLINKKMIEVTGRSEAVGRPYTYGTTQEFLMKFGFSSLKDLPDIQDFEEDRQTRFSVEDPELHQQISLDLNQGLDGEQDEGEEPEGPEGDAVAETGEVPGEN